MTIEEMFSGLCSTHETIGEHGVTLRSYAEKCDHVTEFGVERIGSAWALLAALPKKLVCVDIVHPSSIGASLDEITNAAKEAGVEFQFIHANDLEISIEPTDMLFIDTLHTYPQLSRELLQHAPNVKKYILMHDTETYGVVGSEPGQRGLLTALEEFLASKEGSKWEIVEVFRNMHGLIVIERT
jgi:hypothetical protein